ncbi:hypothetical protein N431DRAFT_436845 [Stipitochalara longipes BDJ]|nr:hypothetical protein N431DRAFT_436845 [Stipitochalara longipes BDJ]
MPGNHDCDCASPWAAPVPNLCELEMEATGSNSVEVEVEECSSPEKTVLRWLERWVGQGGSCFLAFARRMELSISTRSNELVARCTFMSSAKVTLLGCSFPSGYPLLQERPTRNELANSRRSNEG